MPHITHQLLGIPDFYFPLPRKVTKLHVPGPNAKSIRTTLPKMRVVKTPRPPPFRVGDAATLQFGRAGKRRNHEDCDSDNSDASPIR